MKRHHDDGFRRRGSGQFLARTTLLPGSGNSLVFILKHALPRIAIGRPMRTELISIKTDTAPLDGALYQPDNQPANGAILLFHGNVMNFYTGMLRFLPPALTALGFACLAFNRRSHDILATCDSRAAVGGAFQTVARDIEDNRIAASWLAQQGFPDPIVIGHSNGGMLGTQHV